MKVYTVLSNTYDYFRFTDYLGTYSSLEEAKGCTNGLTFVVSENDEPYDSKCEDEEEAHHVIIVTDLEGK